MKLIINSSKKSQIFVFPFAIILLVACHKNNLKREYYNTGELLSEYYLINKKIEGKYKGYFKNGKLKEVHHYKDGKRIDSSIFYYKQMSQKIKRIQYLLNDSTVSAVYFDSLKNLPTSKGKYDKDSVLIGKWKFYKHGKLERITEFKKIKGETYPNQEWIYNTDGGIIGGNYFQLIYKDSIVLKENFKVLINLTTPYFPRGMSKIMVCLSASDSLDFNYNFSNEDELNRECFQDFKILKEGQKKFSNLDYNYVSETYKKFKTSGDKIVRGIIYEYLIKDKDSLGLEGALDKARKMYFETSVYVKDST